MTREEAKEALDKLISVGLDVGTTTTQLIVSELTVRAKQVLLWLS